MWLCNEQKCKTRKWCSLDRRVSQQGHSDSFAAYQQPNTQGTLATCGTSPGAVCAMGPCQAEPQAGWVVLSTGHKLLPSSPCPAFPTHQLFQVS